MDSILLPVGVAAGGAALGVYGTKALKNTLPGDPEVWKAAVIAGTVVATRAAYLKFAQNRMTTHEKRRVWRGDKPVTSD